MLHNDVRPDDSCFFFTTCGWMMWNWLISALGLGSRIVLYDGAPFAHGPETLFRLAQNEGFTLFGLSPKFLTTVEQSGFQPRQSGDFPNLRRICSTGSPLSEHNFRFVYQSVKPDLHLAPISGGTDILGCFLSGNPCAPVHTGTMQVATLGKDVRVMAENGTDLTSGVGELVCKAPFLGMPIGFWNDSNHHRYDQTYFSRFPGYWCHGDYLERTTSGDYVIHGRSDTVLNPGGVRIGTAEIYQAIEPLPEVHDSIVIGQKWQDDVRIVLFVVLAPDSPLDNTLRDKIRQTIKTQCSPRHCPAKILDVPAIPRTRSGKISEKAVSDIVHQRPVQNREALANPEALDAFQNRHELDT